MKKLSAEDKAEIQMYEGKTGNFIPKTGLKNIGKFIEK